MAWLDNLYITLAKNLFPVSMFEKVVLMLDLRLIIRYFREYTLEVNSTNTVMQKRKTFAIGNQLRVTTGSVGVEDRKILVGTYSLSKPLMQAGAIPLSAL